MNEFWVVLGKWEKRVDKFVGFLGMVLAGVVMFSAFMMVDLMSGVVVFLAGLFFFVICFLTLRENLRVHGFMPQQEYSNRRHGELK